MIHLILDKTKQQPMKQPHQLRHPRKQLQQLRHPRKQPQQLRHPRKQPQQLHHPRKQPQQLHHPRKQPQQLHHPRKQPQQLHHPRKQLLLHRRKQLLLHRRKQLLLQQPKIPLILRRRNRRRRSFDLLRYTKTDWSVTSTKMNHPSYRTHQQWWYEVLFPNQTITNRTMYKTDTKSMC